MLIGAKRKNDTSLTNIVFYQTDVTLFALSLIKNNK